MGPRIARDGEQPAMPDASEQTSSDHRAADIVVRGIERDILSGDLPDRSPLPAERDL
ncbi:MAG: hypothetical protein GY788_11820, partial [bacterium]|nr:hypothetical protein [bacterium]